MEEQQLLDESTEEVALKARPQRSTTFFGQHIFSLVYFVSGMVLAAILIAIALNGSHSCSNMNFNIYCELSPFSICLIEKFTLQAAPVEDLIEYVPVIQMNSLHDRNRYMANAIDGMPDAETDSLWSELYHG